MATNDLSNATYEKAIAAIKKAIKDKPTDAASIVPVLLASMEAVETFALSGDDKKKAVIEVLTAVVNETVKDEQIKTYILAFLPTTIDIIILASKKTTKLNLPKKCKCW